MTLTKALFSALNIPFKVEYIEMPKVLKDKYQYLTRADVAKLRKAGYTKEFTSIDKAVSDYAGYLHDKSYL